MFRILFFLLAGLFCTSSLAADGTISGTVTSQTTGNPISGATIQVIRGNHSIVGTTMTASDGSYSIAGINPGQYTVNVSASGFQTGSIGAKVSNGQVTIVNLALLPNPGTVSGQVTDSLTALPISGATVQVFQNNVLVGSTSTNGSGNYTIPDLALGSSIVIASAATYQTASQGAIIQSGETSTANFSLQSNPGTVSGIVTSLSSGSAIPNAIVELNVNNEVSYSTTTDGSGNYSITGVSPGSYVMHAHATNYQTGITGVTVLAGQTSIVNFALDSSLGTLSGTVRSASTGLPIASALVEVNYNNTVLYSTLTDSSGNYTITGVPPGSYIMHAHATNYQTGIVGAIVQANLTTTVNFSLEADPGTISGTVTSANTALPIAGVLVEVNYNNTVLYSTLTDSSGNYTITGVPPGSYIMHAHATNYQTGIVGAIVEANLTTTVNFSLQSDPGTISGTVTSAITALPIASVLVEVNYNNTVLYSTLTDSSGNYTLTGVPPGSYEMHAHATGYQTGITGAIVQADQTTTVNFALDSSPGTLSGTVISANTGLPIANVQIEVNSNGVVLYSTLTNSSGNYTITGVPPGPYIMHAHATNYQTGITGAIVQAGQPTMVDFSLNLSPGAVAGSVTSASTGLPIGNVLVEINLNNTPVNSTLTDGSGNYIITGMPPGSYVMHAHATNYQTGIVGATLEADQTTTVNFSLQSDPGTMSGTVIDANTGLPVSSALVELNLNNIPIYSTLTDSAGNYLVTGVAVGSYVAHCHATNYQIGIQNVTIAANQTSTVNFSLQSSFGTVTGTVTSATSGLAIAGATVEVNLNNVVIAFALTDNSGNYSIPGIAPGSYVIHAHASTYQIGIQNGTVTPSHTTIVNFSLQSNPSTIQGQITNALTDNPISGGFVQVFQSASLITNAVTDNHGNYTISNLSSANYTLTASATGYYTKSQSFSLTTGEIKTLNLSLMPDSPPINLSGNVINNRFLLQDDRIHHIQWQASQDPTVIQYQVYRNGILLAIISANAPLMYDDHNRNRKVTDVYSVTDTNVNGNTSSAVSISLR